MNIQIFVKKSKNSLIKHFPMFKAKYSWINVSSCSGSEMSTVSMILFKAGVIIIRYIIIRTNICQFHLAFSNYRTYSSFSLNRFWYKLIWPKIVDISNLQTAMSIDIKWFCNETTSCKFLIVFRFGISKRSCSFFVMINELFFATYWSFKTINQVLFKRLLLKWW